MLESFDPSARLLPRHSSMPHPRLFLILGLMLVLPARVGALGLGGGPSSVTLGQPLDFGVVVRLDGDETLAVECVQAEVTVGDRALPAGVRLRSGAANTTNLRVVTAMVVDEPVVTVQISAGCLSKVQRRYVVFADPGAPLGPSAPVMLVQAPAEPVVEAAPPATTTPAPVSSTAQPAPPAALSPRVMEAPAPAPQASRAPAPRRTARAERTPPRNTRAQRAESRRAARPVPAVAAVAREEARPRLKLDPAEAVSASPAPTVAAIEEAFEAVAQAASAARAAASAASASSARIAALESTVEQLRGQAKSEQSELERLRALLTRPQAEAWWLWPLVGLLVLVSFLALWLLWRLRGVQRAQEVAWARASAAAPAEALLRETSPLPLMNSTISAPAPLTPRPSGTYALPLDTSPVPHEVTAAGLRTTTLREPPAETSMAMARTVVLPPNVSVSGYEDLTPRDVSIEELIDVDQQAEFFVALGQDSAAVDLLVAHLRDTGGGSPLTYLKLLEIYQRVSDEPAYERTRQRFNQRYNAYAPQWGSDLTHGKWLEDYESVLPRLVAAWPRPLDAMAELEALLFRKSRGELFDLPAYRDVLFLYSMARDRMERESSVGDPPPVDLLLPLDAGAEGTARPPVGSSRATSDMPADDHPTAPLDLDLTPPPRTPSSIFDEPVPPPSPRARDSRR